MPDVRAGGVAFREAIEFLHRRLQLPDGEWLRLLREVDAAARDRSAGMSNALVRDILGAVEKAQAEGTTLADFQAGFAELTARHGWTAASPEDSAWRAELTFRTTTMQAAAAGRWEQAQRLKQTRPYLRYVTAGDDRVREAHRAWHDTILPVDHPWWDTHMPPNGFNCRCYVQSLSERDLKRYGLKVTAVPPALNPVIKFVATPAGKRPVEVPAGIDPGFAVNVGKVGLGLPPVPPASPEKLFPELPRTWPAAPVSDIEGRKLADEIEQGQAAWRETLTVDEEEAIAAYKGDSHAVINSVLRGDTDDIDEEDIEAAADLADEISGALSRAALPKAVRTFRGVPAERAGRYSGLKAGDLVEDPGFFSSSLLESIASRFGDLVLEVRIPAQAKAIALVHFVPSINLVEYEVLLAAGYRMKVVERTGARIVLEVLV